MEGTVAGIIGSIILSLFGAYLGLINFNTDILASVFAAFVATTAEVRNKFVSSSYKQLRQQSLIAKHSPLLTIFMLSYCYLEIFFLFLLFISLKNIVMS